MMKRALLTLFVLPALAILFSGCMMAPVVPPIGVVYSDLKVPLNTEFEATAISVKSGKAESVSYVGLVAVGDASAQAAARNGGIQKIDHADYEYFNVLGIYQRYRTVVYGQ